MKLVLWQLAHTGLDGCRPWRWLQGFVPDEWGHFGPTEESCKPRPTPWLFR